MTATNPWRALADFSDSGGPDDVAVLKADLAKPRDRIVVLTGELAALEDERDELEHELQTRDSTTNTFTRSLVAGLRTIDADRLTGPGLLERVHDELTHQRDTTEVARDHIRLDQLIDDIDHLRKLGVWG